MPPRTTASVVGYLVFVSAAACPAPGFQVSEPDLATQGRHELYAGRYEKAIDLYRAALTQNPEPEYYYSLTRALLKARRSKEAYDVAAEALKRSPQTPGTQTAAGLSMFRKGELAQAETYFRSALKLDANYAGALSGLASIYSALSHFRTARDLLKQAYAANPNDPGLMLARANTLKGDEHIAALEQIVLLLDSDCEDARALRVHIASDRAIRGREVRRLVSTYGPARIKLAPIFNTPQSIRGLGLRVQFNRRYTATLLLDTGASGISLTPKEAEKAGLELLTDESLEAKGIGDKKPQDSFRFMASEVRIGDVVFADHPVSVFRSAKDSDIDGLIGTDTFNRFLVSLDFPAKELVLEPFKSQPGDGPEDAKPLPEGFHRIFRSGNQLMIPTAVNGSAAKLFLIDSGSASNFIDTASARDTTGVHGDDHTTVHGVQGKVERVSRADRVTLVFGGFRQDNPGLIAIDLERLGDSMGMAVAGLLGMPVLGQLKLTIDYRAGAVRLDH